MAFAQLGSDNLTPTTILCDIFNGINSVTPLMLGGTEKQAAAKITWALSKLADVGIEGTVLGCPSSSNSPDASSFLYPNSTQEGGPLNPPPSVFANTGNNVYNKAYFTQGAPRKPQCAS